MNAHRRRRLVRLLSVAVVVVLLGEGLTRVLAPYLPAPALYADASAAAKVEQMATVGDRSACPTIALLGSSMTRDDLVPSEMAADDELSVYNAALDAASPSLLAAWFDLEVEPALDPELVVIGLASFDLSDAARLPSAARTSFDAAPLSRRDTFGRLQRPFVRHSAMVRHREDLRDPTRVWRAVQALRRGQRTPSPTEAVDGLLDPDGAGLSRRELEYRPSPAASTILRQDLLDDFDVAGHQQAALADFVAELRDEGREVALLALPVTDGYVDAHPRGGADQRAFLTAVAAVAEDNNAVFVDLHDEIDDDEFADTHHLAGAAADRLSRELPDLLRGAGVAVPSC